MRALAALLCMLPIGGTAQAAWRQAQTRHFTVYSEGSEKSLRAFAVQLEKFDYLLRRMTGVTDPQQGSPVQVYLLSNEGKVKKLARNPNVGGFYTTTDRSAYAVLSRGSKSHEFDLGAEEILFHEYTHHFMLHHFPAAYPAWYVEGFAEFFSVVKFRKDGSMQFGNIPMVRVPGLVLGQPYPLKQLFARDTDGLGASDGDRFYGTGWLLTHFYFQHKSDRAKEISAYLNALAQGELNADPDRFFSGGLDGLQKDLKNYMRGRVTATILTPKEMVIGNIEVQMLDAARGALVEDELRLYKAQQDDLPDLIESLRKTAAEYPGSGYAHALLAEALWDADDKAAALAEADAAIALDPSLSRAHATRARVLLERAQESGKEADWTAALGAIVKANRADTEDPVPLELYYRYHAMRGGEMPQLGFEGLQKAFELLPQRAQYRFMLAQALARRKDYRAASRLLDPIAYSPHDSSARAAALRRKARLDRSAERQEARKAAKAAPKEEPEAEEEEEEVPST